VGSSPVVNVVLVHGAWHDATCWDPLRAIWTNPTIILSALELPSVDGTGDLSRDAAAVVEHCGALEGPVVLVAHSYGGAVVTQASAQIPSLLAVIFVAAIKPTLGASVSSMSKLSPARSDLDQALSVRDDQLILDLPAALPALYSRDDSDVVAWVKSSTHPQSVATFTERLSGQIPLDVTTTYVMCLEDRAITPELQRIMAESCNRTVELKSGHCPNVDSPEMLAAVLEAEVQRSVSK
jgi:pimeloyl-ACP methyl ester carboxylesterase